MSLVLRISADGKICQRWGSQREAAEVSVVANGVFRVELETRPRSALVSGLPSKCSATSEIAGTTVLVRIDDHGQQSGQGFLLTCEPFPPFDHIARCKRSAPLPGRPERPSISCVLVTMNRPAFAAHAFSYFDRFRYPNRELVIVDSSVEPLVRETMGKIDRVRSEHRPGMSIGMARNVGISLATGDAVVFIDDDDFYGPAYLDTMADALRFGELVNVRDFHSWSCLTRKGWLTDRPGGASSLALWREAFFDGRPFRNTSEGEDGKFVQDRPDLAATTVYVQRPSSYVYVRHAGSGHPGQYDTPPDGCEMTTEVRAMMGADAEFYDRVSACPKRFLGKSLQELEPLT